MPRVERGGCPSFPIDRLEACPTSLYQASGATDGLTSPAIRGISYRHSHKCFLNGAVLLDKPAVAPTCQTVFTFENCFNLRLKMWDSEGRRVPRSTRGRRPFDGFYEPSPTSCC
jgi:hypothetical protein